MNISVISFYHDGQLLEAMPINEPTPIPREGELVITTKNEMCLVKQVSYRYHSGEVCVYLDKQPGSFGISGNIGRP